MASKTSRAVTIAAKFVGGSSIKKEATEAADGVKHLSDETVAANDKAKESGSGWSFFGKSAKSAGDEADKAGHKLKGMAGSLLGMGAGFAAGYIGLNEIKSGIQDVGEKETEVQKAKALGLGGSNQETLDILTAYKARGIAVSQLGMTMKQLAKASYSANKEEQKFISGTANKEESRKRSMESYSRAIDKARESGTKMPLAPLNPEETRELGTKAKAFKELGINIGNFKKLSGSSQLKEIGEALTKMPIGPERTRIATELLGRSAQKVLPMYTKGGLGMSSMEKYAKEYMPDFKGGAKGMEEIQIAEIKMSMASEGLKLRIGMMLAPVILKVTKVASELFKALSHGKGVWGTLETVVKIASHTFKEVYGWISHSAVASKALVGVLMLLAAWWMVEKVANFAKAIRATWLITKLFSGATKEATAVQEVQAATTTEAATQMTMFDAATAGATDQMALFLPESEGVATGMDVMNTATVDATAASTGFLTAETAMTAGLILIPIAIMLVVTHWKLFKKVLVDVWGWIKSHWKLLAQILLLPILGPAVLIIFHWKQVVKFFESVPDKLKAAGSHMWDFVKESFKEALNWVIGVWNKLHFKLPSVSLGPLGHIGGGTIGLPHIPLLANGGTVTHRGWAVVGDQGPEMINLSPGAQVAPLNNRGPQGGGGAFEGNGGDLHVHVDIDRRQVAEAVLKEFRQRGARA